MVLAHRLRVIRVAKQVSPADIEMVIGVPAGYVFQVEEGDIVPSIETLEKWAKALDVSLGSLFVDDGVAPFLSNLPNRLSSDHIARACSEKKKRRFRNISMRPHAH
jgi:transcriptional regulator with XRE-family HTH domain